MAHKDGVICINSGAFYALIDEVVAHIDVKHGVPRENNWIDADAAMEMLKITSRTTLQNMRDEGKIRFFKTSPKNILYDRNSILKHIDSSAQETF